MRANPEVQRVYLGQPGSASGAADGRSLERPQSHVETYYGESHILFDLSLEVEAGEVVCLLGRNGAGKTTTVRSIIGLTPPRAGRIASRGHDLAGLPPYPIARLGIGFVPEDRRVFPNLTVRENLEVARRTGGTAAASAWTEARVFDLSRTWRRCDTATPAA